jgi:hypothetical protein
VDGFARREGYAGIQIPDVVLRHEVEIVRVLKDGEFSVTHAIPAVPVE